jgi:hypothetical protein
MYPRLKCLVEHTKSAHQKYYPLELVEIYSDDGKNNEAEDEQSNLVIDEVPAYGYGSDTKFEYNEQKPLWTNGW